MRIPFAVVFAVELALAASPSGGQTTPAPSDEHRHGVVARGDHVMGFDHARTTHHFRLYGDGGAIEVAANDAADAASARQIRTHLRHIARMFSEGDFEAPMLIHDRIPPGVDVLKRKRGSIRYVFERLPSGGRVRIRTADPQALAAIHEFLRFQISDHRTGDSGAVEAEKRSRARP